MGQSTPQIDYSINYTNGTSLHNWVQQIDLICVKDAKIGLIGSAFFIGWTSTLLFVPYYADKRGRKWIYFVSVLATTLLMIGLSLSKSVNVTITLMFFLGVFNSGRTMVGYVYGNEFCTAKWQVVFGTCWNVGEAITYTLIAVYFDWISKYWWYLNVIALIYLVYAMSVLLFFAPESPLWLLKTGQT